MVKLLRMSRVLLAMFFISSTWVYTLFIDITPLFQESTSSSLELNQFKRSTIAADIDFSLRENGYFIVDHPLVSLTIPKALEAAKSLFNTTTDLKHNFSINNLHSFGRGFIPFGAEAGVGSYYEVKEGFSYGFPGNSANDLHSNSDTSRSQKHPMQQPNIWPPFVTEEKKESFDRLFVEKAVFCQLILSLLAEHVAAEGKNGLDGVSVAFDNYVNRDNEGGDTISLMRIFHYFADSAIQGTDVNEDNDMISPNRTRIGSSPHTDWGVLTVISYNSVPGLQFFDRKSGRWKDLEVPAHVRHPVVVNAGDYLKLVSGNRYHSPVHRVLCPPSTLNLFPDTVRTESPISTYSDRISFVFFFYPHPDSLIPIGESLRVCENENCQHKPVIKDDASTVKGHFEDFEFNTLLDLKSSPGDDALNITFGDYIMAKWKGVYH